MKKILVIVALMPTVLLSFIGCKKNSNNKGQCRIISLKFPLNNGSDEDILYDSKGRIERIITGASANIYAYEGNTLTITNIDSGKTIGKTIVTSNPAGLAVNVRTEKDNTGTEWYNGANEYNGEEIVKTINTSSQDTTRAVTNYLWTDHNMTAAISGTDTTKFEYYTDKPRQAGDFLSILQLLEGYEIYRTKNLVKGYGGAVFVYNFSQDGNISSLQINENGNSTILDMAYQCE